jgi:hypothetical protein
MWTPFCGFFGYFADRRSDHSTCLSSIKVKLANSSMFLLRLIDIYHLSILEDSLEDLLAVKKDAPAIRFVDQPASFIECSVMPVHLTSSMS